jgi:flagellar biosynthesis GTPase FlhF
MSNQHSAAGDGTAADENQNPNAPAAVDDLTPFQAAKRTDIGPSLDGDVADVVVLGISERVQRCAALEWSNEAINSFFPVAADGKSRRGREDVPRFGLEQQKTDRSKGDFCVRWRQFPQKSQLEMIARYQEEEDKQKQRDKRARKREKSTDTRAAKQQKKQEKERMSQIRKAARDKKKNENRTAKRRMEKSAEVDSAANVSSVLFPSFLHCPLTTSFVHTTLNSRPGNCRPPVQ